MSDESLSFRERLRRAIEEAAKQRAEMVQQLARQEAEQGLRRAIEEAETLSAPQASVRFYTDEEGNAQVEITERQARPVVGLDGSGRLSQLLETNTGLEGDESKGEEPVDTGTKGTDPDVHS